VDDGERTIGGHQADLTQGVASGRPADRAVLASLVNFYNPSTVVVGGSMADLRDDLMAGIRSVVYHRTLPLATRRLTIEATALGLRAGVTGSVMLAAEHACSPAAMSQVLAARGMQG
jgi:hypothetical protein